MEGFSDKEEPWKGNGIEKSSNRKMESNPMFSSDIFWMMDIQNVDATILSIVRQLNFVLIISLSTQRQSDQASYL